MEQYTQGIFTILSLVNPVICGLLFSQAVSGKPRVAQVTAATRVMLIIMVILWFAAIGGTYLLKAFAIYPPLWGKQNSCPKFMIEFSARFTMVRDSQQ